MHFPEVNIYPTLKKSEKRLIDFQLHHFFRFDSVENLFLHVHALLWMIWFVNFEGNENNLTNLPLISFTVQICVLY